MPIPKPRKGEEKDKFISRCMSDDVMQEYDQEQRAAICYDSWRNKDKKNVKYWQSSTFLRFNVEVPDIRYETLGERTYLIAPVVAIKEGVLNGEFVPADEIAESAPNWEGIPLTVGHPKKDGIFVLVSDDVNLINEEVVGTFKNVHFNGNSLIGELWIDIDRASKTVEGQKAVAILETGGSLEVSTGYLAEVVPIKGFYRGENYMGSQRNIIPDHLALLPDEVGACSWEDGCGAPRQNKLTKARTPSYSGTENTAWSKPTWNDFKNAWKGSGDIGGVEDAPQGLKSFAAKTSLLGDSNANTFEDLVSFPVVRPSNKKLNANALRNAISRASQANISAETAKSVQAVARRLLEKHFKDNALYEENKEGGEERTMDSILCALNKLATFFGFKVEESEEHIQGLKVQGQNFAKLLDQMIKDQTSPEHPRRDILKEMATQAGISKEKMKEILDGSVEFVPRRWVEMFAQVLGVDMWDLLFAVGVDGANYIEENLPAFKEKTDKSTEPTIFSQQIDEESNVNITKEESEDMNKDELINAVIANEGNAFTEEDRETLKSLDETILKKLSPVKVQEETVEEVKEEVVEEVKVQEEVVEEVKEEVVEEAKAQEETVEEVEAQKDTNKEETIEDRRIDVKKYLAEMPDEVKAVVEPALQAQTAKKQSLIESIVKNSNFTEEDLANEAMNKLEKLAALVLETPAPNYAGAPAPRSNVQDNSIPPMQPIVLAKPKKREIVN